MITIEGEIPHVDFDVNGKTERVQFTGARVVQFWRLAREVYGWDKLPTSEIGRIIESNAPIEVDEDRVIAAVDSFLPEGLRGCLRYQQAIAAFREAFEITLAEMFAPVEDAKKKLTS